MRKNLTKKLFLSVLTLAFAVISLGASTYAWFTLSKDATVDTFQGKVTAGTSGLEIQITNFDVTTPVESAWSVTSIPASVINGFLDPEFKFAAVQFDQSNYTFKTQAQALEAATGNATFNKDYIAFNVHFRLSDAAATDADVNLYLKELGFTTTNVSATPWNAAKSYTDGNGSTIAQGPLAAPYYVQDAARVAFDTSSTYDHVYEATSGSDHYTSAKAGHTNLGAVDYYNKVNEQEAQIEQDGAMVDNPKYIKVPAGYYKPEQKPAENVQLGVLPNDGSSIYVTVYVWVEGWDAECINNIFSQILSIDMSFTIE